MNNRIPDNLALVIGTFGAPAYIHLHLEVRKRYYPYIPAIVIDDASPYTDALQVLCQHYDVSFLSNPKRFGHVEGDLEIIKSGLEFAKNNKKEYLIKFSRRFVPLVQWPPMFAKTLEDWPGLATFTGDDNYWKFPTRTECIAFNVERWLEYKDELKSIPRMNAEQIVYNMAVKVWPVIGPDWGLCGVNRKIRIPHVMWHEIDSPEDYMRISQSLGINSYSLVDYEKPNAGLGRGLRDWYDPDHKDGELPRWIL